jgi:hypothetical protein
MISDLFQVLQDLILHQQLADIRTFSLPPRKTEMKNYEHSFEQIPNKHFHTVCTLNPCIWQEHYVLFSYSYILKVRVISAKDVLRYGKRESSSCCITYRIGSDICFCKFCRKTKLFPSLRSQIYNVTGLTVSRTSSSV